MDKTFLITGASGQLAKEFQAYFTDNNIKFSAPAEEELDVTDAGKIEAAIGQLKPDIILNCAAFNDVDKAEDEPDKAFRVNTEAVKNLVSMCKKYNVFLVHYSSDYVFDGKKEGFYTEKDTPNPLNKYGESKLRGEEEVIRHLSNYLVIRSSWVIGGGKQNFLYKVSEWAKEKPVLRISADEVSVPTYTEDIVDVTMLALEKKLFGLYHLVNSGYCSRYELAKYFVQKMGLPNLVLPVPINTFGIKTPRPLFSAMSNEKISKQLNISIPKWEYGVDRFVKGFKKT